MSERPVADSLVRTLGDLIALRSSYPPGDTREIAAYVAHRLRASGFDVEVLHRMAGVDNVIGRMGTDKPSLVFNAHLDTVDPGVSGNWVSNPFEAVVRDEHVYGLGASNCKGSIAVQLWLADEIARCGGPRNGEIVFTFVGDEERLGPDGMLFLRDTGKIRPDILVLGAPTENQLLIEERGVMWVKVSAYGKAAHAGEPHIGDNAILRMIRLIDFLERRLTPTLSARQKGEVRSTMNIGRIRGGDNTNVVPSWCEVEIDRRLLPDERIDTAFAEMRAAVAAAGEPEDTYQIDFVTGTNGFTAQRDSTVVEAFAAAFADRMGQPPKFTSAVGASDGRHFSDNGIEILICGPGDPREGHATNESVAVSQLLDAAWIYLDATRRIVGLRSWFPYPPC